MIFNKVPNKTGKIKKGNPIRRISMKSVPDSTLVNYYDEETHLINFLVGSFWSCVTLSEFHIRTYTHDSSLKNLQIRNGSNEGTFSLWITKTKRIWPVVAEYGNKKIPVFDVIFGVKNNNNPNSPYEFLASDTEVPLNVLTTHLLSSLNIKRQKTYLPPHDFSYNYPIMNRGFKWPVSFEERNRFMGDLMAEKMTFGGRVLYHCLKTVLTAISTRLLPWQD